jgi:hypothetical protein
LVILKILFFFKPEILWVRIGPAEGNGISANSKRMPAGEYGTGNYFQKTFRLWKFIELDQGRLPWIYRVIHSTGIGKFPGENYPVGYKQWNG